MLPANIKSWHILFSDQQADTAKNAKVKSAANSLVAFIRLYKIEKNSKLLSKV